VKFLDTITRWLFAGPGHSHVYEYHAYRSQSGDYRFVWRCTFILCDAEIEDDSVPY
jgi:hypothetical protein